jgi:Flp pilus assembly protein CpaB
MLVIGLLTAVVGSAMQAVIRDRRRRRPTSLSERTHGIVTKGRWLLVGTLILCTLATAGVVAYSRRVEVARAINERIVAVVVFDVDIPAGTDLDEVIKNDQLELVQVPADVIVDGTVTSVDQLSHRRTRVAIHAGEPILAG